jgi:flagellar hook-associated protein 2
MAIGSTSGPQVAFTGFATGLDSNSIIEALVAVRRVEQDRLSARVSKLQKQQTAYGALRTKLSSLRAKADAINTVDKLGSAVASSTDDTVATATASGRAAEGTYNVTVTSLATTAAKASIGFTDKDTTEIGSGGFDITSGGTTYTIDVGSNATLEQIRDAINASDAPVNASIVDDGTPGAGFRLVLTSQNSGTAGNFTVSDSRFTYAGDTLGLSVVTAAADAQFTVNGLSVTRSTNVVSDVVDGATFTLKKGGGASSVVTIARDLDAVKKKITDFVAAYNDVATELRTHRNFAERDGKAVLFGEANLNRIGGRLRTAALAGVTGTGSTYDRLSDIGIRTDPDGKLAIEDGELREALEADYEGVTALFTQIGTGNANGLARSLASTVGDAITGFILPRNSALATQASTLRKRIDSMETGLERYAEQLRTKYAALESFAGRYQQAGAALGSI